MMQQLDTLFNTGETAQSLRNRYNPDGSNLRRAQLRLLDMLTYLSDEAQAIGVSIRLDGGNVLGALRHQGFIPWDDDIDVVVDRKDYHRLCDHLLTHPHPRYVLRTHETDRDYFLPWAQLTDLDSEYTCPFDESHRDWKAWHMQRLHGLHVDIFPYESHKIPLLHALSVKMSCVVCFDIAPRFPWIARILFRFLRDVAYPFFRFLGKCFGNPNLYMHSYGSWFYFKFPKEVLLPHQPLVFEGQQFEGPANPDAFCRILYGEYMKLPPEEKRAVHGDEIIIHNLQR